MAITQISRITHRKGLSENLPQLAGAEFGWCVDTRRLFIGNGTLNEGAPVVGNTELLTEFSSIPTVSYYTYQGEAAGYVAQTGPSLSEPVSRLLQERLDDFVSVRSYGAIGDGIVDDTAAINQALFDMYCKSTEPRARRALYFPAGTYRISDTLVIPVYAKIVGDGADCTIFQMDADVDVNSVEYVARYADGVGAVGANMMGLGAMPADIEISGVTFKTLAQVNVFLVENATQCHFDSVIFQGPYTELTVIPDPMVTSRTVSALSFSSINAVVCSQVTMDKCAFIGATYGVTANVPTRGISITNSRFDTCQVGVSLGNGPVSGAGAAGFRITNNMFDRIYARGIEVNVGTMTVSAHNVFYDVGNELIGSPAHPNIFFASDNNVSICDMFARTDFANNIVARIAIGSTPSTTTAQLQLGQLTLQAGRIYTLNDGQVNQTMCTLNTEDARAFAVDYTIVRDQAIRSGSLLVASASVGTAPASLRFTDDYVENAETFVELDVEQITETQAAVKCSATVTGFPATITFSIRHL